MAALVTLNQAKQHLRITTEDQDIDVNLKVDQASAIILDYLKGRANVPVTILTSSVASPTVITTDGEHLLSNGDTVAIVNHADSTPSLTGSYVISGVTQDTFTIPIAVTVAGSGGTATKPWTDLTAPGPVQAAVLLMLTHLHEHRGDDMDKYDEGLWKAIERLLMRSRDPAFA